MPGFIGSQRIFRRMPFTLDDAEQLAAAAPRSFFIPPPEIRHGLKPGDLVKLIFRLEREDGEAGVERMWVEVVETQPYVGTLENEPCLKGVIEHGERVTFGPEHVAAYAYSEEELGYDPAGDCFVSASVLERDAAPEGLYVDADGVWVAVVGRERPEHRWSLGYLTDRFPEAAVALREGRDERETWWRREGDGYVRA